MIVVFADRSDDEAGVVKLLAGALGDQEMTGLRSDSDGMGGGLCG
ncbi:hypothetical protein [Alcaligenes faecalis]|nr:hypothetical protein [Alcaligenes faecalis]